MANTLSRKFDKLSIRDSLSALILVLIALCNNRKVVILTLNFLLIKYGEAVMYQKNPIIVLSRTEIVSEQDEPSLLSCAQRCTFRKAEFVYEEPLCTCLVNLYTMGKKKRESHQKTLSGEFYKVCY